MKSFRNKKSIYSFKTTYASNPIAHPNRSNKYTKLLIKVFIFVCLPIFLSAYFIFFSNYFKIKKVTIEGLDESSIEAQLLQQYNGKNIFLVDFDKLKSDFLTKNSNLQELSIIRGIPDTLKVKFKNKTPKLIWQSEDKNYVLDEQGYPFAQVKEVKSWNESEIPIIRDSSKIVVTTDRKILSKFFIDQLSLIKERFNSATSLEVVEVTTVSSSLAVNIKASNGWDIKLNLAEDIDYQLKNISAIKNSKNVITTYLDLRIPGYAYYK